MNNFKYKYVYHVVYMSTHNIYGDCTLHRAAPINNETETKSVREYISKESCNGEPVILLNFILLNNKGW